MLLQAVCSGGSRPLLRQGGIILLSGRMGGLTLVRALAWLLIRRRPDLARRARDQRNTISPSIVVDELHVLELRMEVLARFALPEEGGTILLSGRMGGPTLVRAPALLLIWRRPDLALRARDQRNMISPAPVADDLHVLEMQMEVMASYALPTAEHLPGLDALELRSPVISGRPKVCPGCSDQIGRPADRRIARVHQIAAPAHAVSPCDA